MDARTNLTFGPEKINSIVFNFDRFGTERAFFVKFGIPPATSYLLGQKSPCIVVDNVKTKQKISRYFFSNLEVYPFAITVFITVYVCH